MSDLSGRRISHYRLLSALGAGGMGVVYRARDERLGRDLALKLLPAESMADETARARLMAEARTASSLNHPGIAHIYEVGEDDGTLYIAMELVEGRTLQAAIPPAGLPTETLLRYGLQIADALAYAHERGVIHRDIKSANVMVTAEGRVKVLDFGLAKRLPKEAGAVAPRDTGLTATGMVLGTPNYLPPEVLLGGKADAHGDVWALGVVLYEMASGKLPFGGGSVADLASAIVNDPPTPLSGRVPTGIQAVIARCLAKEPGRRYRQGGEARVALEALQQAALPRAGGGLSPRVWIPVAGLALAAVATLLVLGLPGIRGRSPVLSGRPRITSLAVLPLTNLSGDPEQEYFADGMTEELITSLAPIQSLKVISRTSVMRFKGSKQPLGEIARQLGVDGIIEGSVQRAGGRVRITAQLIDAPHDRHLWARSYDRDFRDVLSIQGEVAQDIAREIQIQVSPEESARLANRRAVNAEAYELYLKGRYEWGKMTREGVQKGLDFYRRALAIDPGDARYSSGMADAYLVQVQVLGAPYREGMAKVKEYALRALAADEGSAEAHTSMGAALFFADWDRVGAERHLRRAIELNPGYSTARLVYSVLLGAAGRFEEAIGQDRLAMRLDPFSLLVNWNAAGTLLLARRYEESLAQARKSLAVDRTSVLPQTMLLQIYETTGDYRSALDILEEFLPEEDGGKALVGKLRRAYAESGPKGYWRTMYEFSASPARASKSQPTWLAGLSAQSGNADVAMEHLQRAYEEHSPDLLFLTVEPRWDLIRSDPRFQALVRRMGLTPRA